MRAYIAYKFTNVTDRQNLKDEITTVTSYLEKNGISTFVLGRDVQNWSQKSYPFHHKLFTIMTNIIKSDLVVAFVNSEVFSKGLMFELHFAKFIGKRICLVTKQEFLTPALKLLANKTVLYSNLNELETALTCIRN